MTNSQRTIILIGLLSAFLMILVPPWKGSSYRLIFDPPAFTNTIDFPRLQIQFAMVAILCVALFLIPKPTSIDADQSEADGARSTMPSRQTFIVLTSFIALTIGATGWHFFQKHQLEAQVLKAQKDKKEALAVYWNAKNAGEAERQNRELQYREQQAREAAQVAQEIERLEQKQQAADKARLYQLALPKRFNIKQQISSGVTGFLQICWKDGAIYYLLKLQGSATNLEYAIDQHPNFSVALLTRDGLEVAKLNIQSSTLQPLRQKSGAIIGMSSPREVVGCSLESFESIRGVQLASP